MQNEHLINYKDITSKLIENYKKQHPEVHEITCLVPKGCEKEEKVLRENGFRYIGKRYVNNEMRIVFTWYKELNNPYEEMASFFNRRVNDYDLHMQDFKFYDAALYEMATHISTTSEEMRILDLGCGTGRELQYVFQRVPNAKVVCVDMSKGMLDKLLETFKDHQHQIETIASSYLTIDLGNEKYDYIIACNTLHHLLKEDKLLLYKNIKKALSKNGVFLIVDYVVSETEEEEFRSRYYELLTQGHIKENELYHIDLTLSLKSEKKLLSQAGFTYIDIKNEENDILVCAN